MESIVHYKHIRAIQTATTDATFGHLLETDSIAMGVLVDSEQFLLKHFHTLIVTALHGSTNGSHGEWKNKEDSVKDMEEEKEDRERSVRE